MTNIPKDLRYTKDHEWVRASGDAWAVGITDFAVSQLGDITMVQTPKVGDTVTAGAVFGVVESVKSVSDLYAPVSGKVARVNEELDRSPERVNEGCYEAWIVEIEPSDRGELEKLLTHEQYAEIVASS